MGALFLNSRPREHETRGCGRFGTYVCGLFFLVDEYLTLRGICGIRGKGRGGEMGKVEIISHA